MSNNYVDINKVLSFITSSGSARTIINPVTKEEQTIPAWSMEEQVSNTLIQNAINRKATTGYEIAEANLLNGNIEYRQGDDLTPLDDNHVIIAYTSVTYLPPSISYSSTAISDIQAKYE